MNLWRRSAALLLVINAIVLLAAASATLGLTIRHRVAAHDSQLVPAAAPIKPQDVWITHHREVPVPTRHRAKVGPSKPTPIAPQAITLALPPAPARVVPPAPSPTDLAHRVPPVPVASGPTGWDALNQAIARIPHYVPGSMTWLVSTAYGSWGTADMGARIIYISPSVPGSYLYDVAVHEWSHIRSVDPYHGDPNAAVAAMNRYYGGFGMNGAEDAADCMAILLGAHWTHYTACPNSFWQAGAARLVRGLAV